MTRGMSPDTILALSTPTELFHIDQDQSGVETVEDTETGITQEFLLLKTVDTTMQPDKSRCHLYIV